jgi:hypothetical protein
MIEETERIQEPGVELEEIANKTDRSGDNFSPIMQANTPLEQDSSVQFTLRANAYNSFAQDAPNTHVNFDNLSQQPASR